MQFKLLVVTVSINYRTMLQCYLLLYGASLRKQTHIERYVTMPLFLSFLLPNKHPDKPIYIYMLLLYLKMSITGCHQKIKDCFFNLLFGCHKANFDLNVLNKKNCMNCMLKMIILHPTQLQMLELFSNCSLLITKLTYHPSKT